MVGTNSIRNNLEPHHDDVKKLLGPAKAGWFCVFRRIPRSDDRFDPASYGDTIWSDGGSNTFSLINGLSGTNTIQGFGSSDIVDLSGFSIVRTARGLTTLAKPRIAPSKSAFFHALGKSLRTKSDDGRPLNSDMTRCRAQPGIL
jgi:hypothetical protein